MPLDLLTKASANQLEDTGAVKKLNITIPGVVDSKFKVYKIPLTDLYYNNQNGRINTTYKQFQAENGVVLEPETGWSEYNAQFENFIYESNKELLNQTKESILNKTQQEPGVALRDGRVIDGNRRLTALRKIEEETGIKQFFEGLILPIDANDSINEKRIKGLELDLQLGREERVNYDPIDRIFDVYNTIEVEGLMTIEEYKEASSVTAYKLKQDIEYAKLIIKFIKIVSPGGNPLDKFYLARELKLDGPIEEIGKVIPKLQDSHKQAITSAVLVRLAVAKTGVDETESTKIMRDIKTNVLNNPDMLGHYVDAFDDNEEIDTFIDSFEENPIYSANDLRETVENNEELSQAVQKVKKSTDRLVYKGKKDSKRTKVLDEAEKVRDSLQDMTHDEFQNLKVDESVELREIFKEINNELYRIKKEL